MDTTLHPNSEKARSTDDQVTENPWTLGQGTRVYLPPARTPGLRLPLLLITAALFATGAGAAMWYGMAHYETAPVERKDDPPAKRTEIGKNLFLEIQGDRRRVVVVATVCLREGQLEGLLCRKNTKEHEYILAADVDARAIHAGLIAAKAAPGTPVQFAPKYVPATGSVIKVTLQYQKDGKLVTVRGQDWIQDAKTSKTMEQDWVFGGSRFVADPDDAKKPIYLANYGDVICVCNMESAMLDLPIRSSKSLENRTYHALTQSIPPKDTRVEVILEVMPEKK